MKGTGYYICEEAILLSTGSLLWEPRCDQPSSVRPSTMPSCLRADYTWNTLKTMSYDIRYFFLVTRKWLIKFPTAQGFTSLHSSKIFFLDQGWETVPGLTRDETNIKQIYISYTIETNRELKGKQRKLLYWENWWGAGARVKNKGHLIQSPRKK